MGRRGEEGGGRGGEEGGGGRRREVPRQGQPVGDGGLAGWRRVLAEGKGDGNTRRAGGEERGGEGRRGEERGGEGRRGEERGGEDSTVEVAECRLASAMNGRPGGGGEWW